jgi:hypothetical protein
MTDNRLRLKKCIIANFTLLILMIVIISIFKEPDDKYLRIGPNENLIVMSVKINTVNKYIVLQLFLAITEIIRCVVNEIASPILGFNIYNPDKKIITEFTKNELQIMANSMWLIKSLISALSIMVTISQLDIAILKVIYSELTSVYTIRLLLNEKEFVQEDKSIIELSMFENENLLNLFV